MSDSANHITAANNIRKVLPNILAFGKNEKALKVW